MQIYHYHPDTGECLGVGVADPDPLAPGSYLYPAFSTTAEPPSVEARQAAVFANNAWTVVPDHRGETWYRDDRTSVVIDMLGDPAATGLLPERPPVPPPTAPTEQELTAYAADARYRKEVAGVAWGDYIIQTDRESQSKMLAEFVAMGAGLRTDPSPWKFADNKFAELTNADMAAVCLAGRAHVAAAFAIEQTVQAAISATPPTITTFAEIDAAFA